MKKAFKAVRQHNRGDSGSLLLMPCLPDDNLIEIGEKQPLAKRELARMQ